MKNVRELSLTQEEIKKYQKDYNVYYPTVPTLQTNCPIDYKWNECSSSEYGLCCRTCANYNPLRMLYENVVNKTELGVPYDVLLDDCRIQLKNG